MGEWEGVWAKLEGMVGKQYRVTLHKIGRFLKPSANYGTFGRGQLCWRRSGKMSFQK